MCLLHFVVSMYLNSQLYAGFILVGLGLFAGGVGCPGGQVRGKRRGPTSPGGALGPTQSHRRHSSYVSLRGLPVPLVRRSLRAGAAGRAHRHVGGARRRRAARPRIVTFSLGFVSCFLKGCKVLTSSCLRGQDFINKRVSISCVTASTPHA